MIPPFEYQRVIVEPWTEFLPTYGWVVLMGFLVALACGLLGNFLILRRMALMGDAISHSILPGIVIAFLIGENRGPFAMFVGAVTAGVVTTALIEVIQRRTRIKQDAAMGIIFTSLFAIGVLLVSVFAGQIDLDAECVLYGELGFVGLEQEPTVIFGFESGRPQIVIMGVVCVVVIAFVAAFYKELLVTCFDPGLATSLGIRPAVWHYAFMAMLSVVIVSSFRAVGAILVVATLVLPGATAYLLASRLPTMLALSALHAALSAVFGMHFGVWLNCSFGAALVVAGAILFGLAWIGTSLGQLRARMKAASSLPEIPGLINPQ